MQIKSPQVSFLLPVAISEAEKQKQSDKVNACFILKTKGKKVLVQYKSLYMKSMIHMLIQEFHLIGKRRFLYNLLSVIRDLV